MGWKLKALAVYVGLASFGAGAWPLGLLCFIYLLASLRPKRSGSVLRLGPRISPRYLLAAAMVLLSAVALASGGVLSPIVFLAVGGVLLAWPVLVRRLPLAELVPQGDSIVLRSRFLPILWCAVAEVKPGAEPFPMAASAFSGTLMVNTDTGRTHSLATCLALNRNEAEARVVESFRSAAPGVRAGAYLLPLGAGDAAEVLKQRGSTMKLQWDDLPGSASRVSGLLVLDCYRGTVRKAAAFERAADGAPSPPGRLLGLGRPPLIWEVFDSIGKRTRFPEPDRFSDLLDSMLATRGAPLAERVRELESAGELLTVRSLSGEEIGTTRTQLRAIVSIYS